MEIAANQSAASLIQNAALDRVVRELLQTITKKCRYAIFREDVQRRSPTGMGSRRGRIRRCEQGTGPSSRENLPVPQPKTRQLWKILPRSTNLAPAIDIIRTGPRDERAPRTAIALNRAGHRLPGPGWTHGTGLGCRLQTESGISGHCVRTGEILLCHDTNRAARGSTVSRRLEVRRFWSRRSYFQRTLGIFEVLSASPMLLDQRDVATLQTAFRMMWRDRRVVDLPARIA